jgi:transcriptional regulator with XRE-family HTH domain
MQSEQGLKVLGKIIKSSIEYRGLTQQEAADKISSSTGHYISKGGLNKIMNATTKNPEWNTLVAIAASKLITCDRGIPLTIYDFIDIASENRVTDMDILIKLIKLELQNRGWTLRRMAEETGIELADLLDISEGRVSEDFEGNLTLLALVLTNPKTRRTFTTAEDIAQFCGIKINPTHVDCEQDYCIGLT